MNQHNGRGIGGKRASHPSMNGQASDLCPFTP
jgi:hypothetical protein